MDCTFPQKKIKNATQEAVAQYETEINGKFHFTNENATLSLNSKFDFIKSKIPKDLSLAVLLQHQLSDSIKIATKYTLCSDITVYPTLDTVLEKKVGDDTYKAKISVQNKDQNDLKFSFSAATKLSTHATVSLGVDISARDFIGPKSSDGTSFGFEIKLK